MRKWVQMNVRLDYKQSVRTLLNYVWESDKHPAEPRVEIKSKVYGPYRYKVKYYSGEINSNKPHEALRKLIIKYEEGEIDEAV